MSEEHYSILSDRDFPFSIIILLFTAPINIIFFMGWMVSDMFDYNWLMTLIPLPFIIMNFGISAWFFIFGLINREFTDGCF